MTNVDALQDIGWIKTTRERMSVRDVLLSAHDPEVQMDSNVPGFEYSSQLRLLATVTAVVLQETGVFEDGDDFVFNGLPREAIDRALERLSHGSNLFDPEFPFMQQPTLPPIHPKDTSREVGRGKHPTKKLSPAMPPDAAEDYWNLSFKHADNLEIADAIMALTVFHHSSFAGNSTYDGRKCQMGSPALRWVGADFTLTEMHWHADTLLETLLMAIPTSWVETKGLPAWADRKASRSRDPETRELHPLWKTTWSSNAAATYWENNQLTGVKTGGIPEDWYTPEMGSTAELRKQWWTARSLDDPFFLYRPSPDGDLKLQRLDLGRDTTDLAVEWTSEAKRTSFHSNHRMYRENNDEYPLRFIRHHLAGTPTSGNLRFSTVFTPDPTLWGFDLPEEHLLAVVEHAETIRQVHNAVRGPFRRRTSKDGSKALVLDQLEERRSDASTTFWRNITDVYRDILDRARQEIVTEAEHQVALPSDLAERVLHAALRTFDEITIAHAGQLPAQILFVRGGLNRKIRSILSLNRAASPQDED